MTYKKNAENIDAYKRLGAAICAEFVTDYKRGTYKEKQEAKEFILSDRFTILSGGMDGKEVLSILDAQRGER